MTAQQTVSLAEFLLARIAEDEAVARATGGSVWGFGESIYEEGTGAYVATGPWGGGIDSEFGRHIARHDPARVLAECEAKRRIVAMYLEHDHSAHADHHWSGFDGGYATATDHTLRLLALPYADHEGYRSEWAP